MAGLGTLQSLLALTPKFLLRKIPHNPDVNFSPNTHQPISFRQVNPEINFENLTLFFVFTILTVRK